MGDLFNPTALAAGMLLLLNPCSFALLPSYIGLFLNLENNQEETKPNIFHALSRAQIVSLFMSAGILAVFLPVALAFTRANVWLGNFSYWLSIVLGIGLFLLGVAMLFGYNLVLKLPKFTSQSKGSTFSSIFLYGVSYATAAMGCSLPVVIIGLSLPSGESGFLPQVGLVFSFSLGIVVALTTLTMSVATGRNAMVSFFRKIMTKMNLITGLILIPAGLHLAWYGLYSFDPNKRIKDSRALLEWIEGTPVVGWLPIWDLWHWVDDDPNSRAKGSIAAQEWVESTMTNWLNASLFGDYTRAAVLGILFIALNVVIIFLGYFNRPKNSDVQISS